MSKKLKDLISEIQIKKDLTHEEIAKMTGYTRQYLTVALRKNPEKGKLIDKIKFVFSDLLNDVVIEREIELSEQIGHILEKLISFEAAIKIIGMKVSEVEAQLNGSSYSDEVMDLEEKISEEIRRIFQKQKQKGKF